MPEILCENDDIEISIDRGIECPGGCCTLQLVQ